MYGHFCGFFSFRGGGGGTTKKDYFGGPILCFGSFLRSLYRMGIVFMGGGKGWLKKYSVSTIREYHTHKLQTKSWHGEEEPHNNHETTGRQTKQNHQLFLPHRT